MMQLSTMGRFDTLVASRCAQIKAVKQYIMKYAMKAEKMSRPFSSVMSEMMKHCDDATAAGQQQSDDRELIKLFLRFLNEITCERDFSAVEVCHMGLGLPLVKYSRVPVWLNLCDEEMEPLARVANEDDAESVRAGRATTYQSYLARGSHLESLRLYDLSSKFSDSYEPIQDHLKWRVPHVIPYRSPKVSDDTDPADRELYARDRLRLFVPHRNDDDLKTIGGRGHPSFDSALDEFVETAECPGSLKREVQYAKAHAEEGDDDELSGSDDDGDHADDPVARRVRLREFRANLSLAGLTVDPRGTNNDEPDGDHRHELGPFEQWHAVRGEVQAALDRDGRHGELLTDECEKWLNSLIEECGDGDEFERRAVEPRHLNKGQRFLFNVMVEYDTAKRADDNAPPARIIVPGKAGVGKSFALDAFVHYLITTHDEEVGETMFICAYTGVAALLVGGTTLHRAFRLPTSDFELLKEGSDALNDLMERIGKAKWLFIDERSMVGQALFGMMSKRFKQVTANANCHRPHTTSHGPLLFCRNRREQESTTIPSRTSTSSCSETMGSCHQRPTLRFSPGTRDPTRLKWKVEMPTGRSNTSSA